VYPVSDIQDNDL